MPWHATIYQTTEAYPRRRQHNGPLSQIAGNSGESQGTPANLHLRAQQIPQNILLFLRWSQPPPYSFNSQWSTGHVSNLMLTITNTETDFLEKHKSCDVISNDFCLVSGISTSQISLKNFYWLNHIIVFYFYFNSLVSVCILTF